MKLLTAYSVAQLDVVRATGELVLAPASGTEPPLAVSELLLTEDPAYWHQVIEAQPDRGQISDYRYAYVISVEVPSAFVAALVTSSEYGRIGPEVAAMLERLARPGPVPHPLESEIFVLQRIEESAETVDGMTQPYVLRGGMPATIPCWRASIGR